MAKGYTCPDARSRCLARASFVRDDLTLGVSRALERALVSLGVPPQHQDLATSACLTLARLPQESAASFADSRPYPPR